MSLIKYFISIVLFFSITTLNAEVKCKSFVDNELKELGMGTFSKPSLRVDKKTIGSDARIFEFTNGQTVVNYNPNSMGDVVLNTYTYSPILKDHEELTYSLSYVDCKVKSIEVKHSGEQYNITPERCNKVSKLSPYVFSDADRKTFAKLGGNFKRAAGCDGAEEMIKRMCDLNKDRFIPLTSKSSKKPQETKRTSTRGVN